MSVPRLSQSSEAQEISQPQGLANTEGSTLVKAAGEIGKGMAPHVGLQTGTATLLQRQNPAAEPKPQEPSWLDWSTYTDDSFPGKTIAEFASALLNTPIENLESELFQALPKAKRTEENRIVIGKSLDLSVNASGAVMLFVNTEEGLQLIAANSQRRKTVIQVNGACEANESMKRTAHREFFEELGNPDRNGILSSILADDKNCVSIVGVNKIGDTAAQIANRLVECQGEQRKLYLNASALYINKSQILSDHLNNEIDKLNRRITILSPYYKDAVTYVFGKKDSEITPLNLKENDASRKIAVDFIKDFKEKYQETIPEHFKKIFSHLTSENLNPDDIKSALNAIIDLTENYSIQKISEKELEYSVDLFQSNKDEFKKTFFSPAFEPIFTHTNIDQSEFLLNFIKYKFNY